MPKMIQKEDWSQVNGMREGSVSRRNCRIEGEGRSSTVLGELRI